jgi:hypothetical protein
MPQWKVTAIRATGLAVAVILLLSAIAWASHGQLWAAGGFVAFGGYCLLLERRSVVRLEWHGDRLDWTGVLGNSGSVSKGDIAGVTSSAMQPLTVLIKLMRGAPLRVRGPNLAWVVQFVAR